MREDRVLKPDEVPIFWCLDERQRAAFIRLANKLGKSCRTVCVAGIEIGLAPFSAAVPPLSEMQLRASQPICGMSAIEEILERDRSNRG
jgi:hypothetical protein